MSLLELSRIQKVFGGLSALKDVSLAVDEASIFGLIGPNGAGKTTLFNVVTGVYRPDGGTIHFKGERLDGAKPAVVAASGIARTFQNIRLFRSMTVEQNVMVAGHHVHRSGLLDAVLRTRAYQLDEDAMRRRAHEMLEILGLRQLAGLPADSLPYGSQRRLEIARALMLDPRVLLLDEPAAGMNSQEARELEQQLRFLRDQLQLTLLLVEHNMSVVMNVCDRIHVLDHGETIAEGSPQEIMNDPAVLAAYLGEEGTA